MNRIKKNLSIILLLAIIISCMNFTEVNAKSNFRAYCEQKVTLPMNPSSNNNYGYLCVSCNYASSVYKLNKDAIKISNNNIRVADIISRKISETLKVYGPKGTTYIDKSYKYYIKFKLKNIGTSKVTITIKGQTIESDITVTPVSYPIKSLKISGVNKGKELSSILKWKGNPSSLIDNYYGDYAYLIGIKADIKAKHKKTNNAVVKLKLNEDSKNFKSIGVTIFDKTNGLKKSYYELQKNSNINVSLGKLMPKHNYQIILTITDLSGITYVVYINSKK